MVPSQLTVELTVDLTEVEGLREVALDEVVSTAFIKRRNTAILQRTSRSMVVNTSVVSLGISGMICLNRASDAQNRQFGHPFPNLIH